MRSAGHAGIYDLAQPVEPTVPERHVRVLDVATGCVLLADGGCSLFQFGEGEG